MIDVMFLIVMIGVVGVLFNFFVSFLVCKIVEFGEEVVDVVGEEIVNVLILFGCLGFSILFVVMVFVMIVVCMDWSCGKLGCKGFWKVVEFDLYLEMEEGLKNFNCVVMNGLKKGFFELFCDYYSELEVEFKKMVLFNGSVVLVFRVSCGCFIGSMDVFGLKKFWKVKK